MTQNLVVFHCLQCELDFKVLLDGSPDPDKQRCPEDYLSDREFHPITFVRNATSEDCVAHIESAMENRNASSPVIDLPEKLNIAMRNRMVTDWVRRGTLLETFADFL